MPPQPLICTLITLLAARGQSWPHVLLKQGRDSIPVSLRQAQLLDQPGSLVEGEFTQEEAGPLPQAHPQTSCCHLPQDLPSPAVLGWS